MVTESEVKSFQAWTKLKQKKIKMNAKRYRKVIDFVKAKHSRKCP